MKLIIQNNREINEVKHQHYQSTIAKEGNSNDR